MPADVVVSAGDLHHTQTALLPAGYADQPAGYWEDRGPGISALLVLAGVRGDLPELAHHSLFFTEDWQGNFEDILGDEKDSPVDSLRIPAPASLYVSRTSATDDATIDHPPRRPATRTSSCSSRSPRTRCWARPRPPRSTSRRSPTATSTRSVPGPGSTTCADGS
ncbi:hypothetical protein NKG05_08540 [Oerskovia sp. M15]